jgi:hypothetical protein
MSFREFDAGVNQPTLSKRKVELARSGQVSARPPATINGQWRFRQALTRCKCEM